jgi:hypothetical protein
VEITHHTNLDSMKNVINILTHPVVYSILCTIFILWVLSFVGCKKEILYPGDRAIILEYKEPKSPYKYGYIAKGTPTYYSDSLGIIYSITYKFELYTDTLWHINDDITGKLCHCDSLITLHN